MTRSTLFVLCVIVWTVGLFMPIPKQSIGSDTTGIPDLKFYFSKTLHVVAYAFLTAFAAHLRLSRPQRIGVIVFLSLHGFATEFLQSALTSRTGSLRDVGLDHLGIFIGLLLTFRRWRKNIRLEPGQE